MNSPAHAGTFWYYPTSTASSSWVADSAGALIVEERQPIPVDRDVLWVLTDWRIHDNGQIDSRFGNMMEAGMSGRVGNTVTLNGGISADQSGAQASASDYGC